MPKIKYLVGIDEAGRGPIAGPVAVGAVAIRLSTDLNLDTQCPKPGSPFGHCVSKFCVSKFVSKFGPGLPLRDSKKLTARQREAWWRWLRSEKKAGRIFHISALVGPQLIDRYGIVRALRMGVGRCLWRLPPSAIESRILLDGSLYAPSTYANQETIIRGDDSRPIVALASIIAKVRRDRYMCRQALAYPRYGFDQHKGYGTKIHYRQLAKYGLSPLHRRSFCGSITGPNLL
ncbi:MAG: ribonuclease HII [Patescibacteria group bacterium]|nr:ribonuclease HII [Patescibacteria group bacterium]